MILYCGAFFGKTKYMYKLIEGNVHMKIKSPGGVGAWRGGGSLL